MLRKFLSRKRKGNAELIRATMLVFYSIVLVVIGVSMKYTKVLKNNIDDTIVSSGLAATLVDQDTYSSEEKMYIDKYDSLRVFKNCMKANLGINEFQKGKTMDYLLFKKNDPILSFNLSKNNVVRMREIFTPELLPYNMQDPDGKQLKDWLQKRCISQSRPHIDKLYEITGKNSSFELSISCHCVNLTDCYWIKTEEDPVKWEDVDFRANGYSESVGNLLLKNEIYSNDFISPDLTTNGITEKAWKRINDLDYLFKLGRAPFFQEPYNEIACSKVAQCFPVLNAVPYFLGLVGDKPASVCENFLKDNQEFVPASYLIPKGHPQEARYIRLTYVCKELGMHNVKEFLDNMIAFDYIINNTDRHLGNFGFLRNATTGEYLGPAPIFDNGNSLWFDEPIECNYTVDNFSKPFCDYHEDQLKLTKKLDNIDFVNLKLMPEIVRAELLKVCDAKRVDKIIRTFSNRINSLYEYRERMAVQKKDLFKKYSIEEVR